MSTEKVLKMIQGKTGQGYPERLIIADALEVKGNRTSEGRLGNPGRATSLEEQEVVDGRESIGSGS